MAKHAHSTPVPAESNTDATQLNRRAALMALPAMSGVAALVAAAARAAPPSDMDTAIARLEAVQAALKACEAQSWRLSDQVDDVVSVVMGKNNKGEDVRAYSEAEISGFLGKSAEFWGAGSNAEKYMHAKIAEFRLAHARRLKAETDSGLTACLDRLEALAAEQDEAVQALMSIKPVTLGEARRKIAALIEPLTSDFAYNADEKDIAGILRALV